MFAYNVIDKIEVIAPPQLAQDWDNSGLMVGDRNAEVHKVGIALDATSAVIESARQQQIDLLVIHHPLIFGPLKKVTADSYIGKRIISLIKNEMVCYACHTNFDSVIMGELAAQKLGLLNLRTLEVDRRSSISKLEALKNNLAYGFGVVGDLPERLDFNLKELADYTANIFKLHNLRYVGEAGLKIKRVAILPGSGIEAVDLAIAQGAQVLITGDVKHHDALDTFEKGLCLIDGGHFGLEWMFCDYNRKYLEQELPQLEVLVLHQEEPFEIIQSKA